jgi:hypothetical protein
MNKALAANGRGTATKIWINPGTYREFVNVRPTSNQTSANMTFEAVTPGTVAIAGSNVLGGWQQISSTEYVHSWYDTVANCYPPSSWPSLPQITRQSEMVFINGTPLTQIINSSEHRSGTFFVDSGAQQIHIWPAPGTNVNQSSVEVTSRRETLRVNGRNNIVFRGLVLRHAGSCVGTNSVNVYNSNNVLFDQTQVNWNNWGGLAISSSNNVTVQNSVASHNGGAGLTAYQDTNLVFQSTETDYNNWRGAMGAFYDFGMGGAKLVGIHGVKLSQFFAYNNQGQGLWFDTDNKNVTITNATLSQNLLSNLKLEGNEGPVSVQNSSFCSGATGIQVLNTTGLSVTGSNFYNNGGTAKWQAELFLGGNPPGGRVVSDWQNGQTYVLQTSGTTLLNNVFTNAKTNQYVFATFLNGGTWSIFANSLHSNFNAWYNPQSAAFLDPGGHHDTLSGWRNMSGQDSSSSWGRATTATRNCGMPSPSYPDFSVTANNREQASVPVWSQPYSMSGGVVSIPLQLKSFNFGPVTLSTSHLPYGVSASFSPGTLSNGNSVLTLRASSSAAYNTVPITVFATSGSRVHSVTVSVTISSF